MPKKIIGTLTLSILKSMHILISLIIFYKSCSVATPRHPKPLLLENRIYIVTLTPDLQRVSFYSIIVFLHHISTTELILSPIFIKESYSSSKASLRCRESLLALVAAVACRFHTRSPRGSVPRIKARRFWLVRNNPAHIHNIYAVILIM